MLAERESGISDAHLRPLLKKKVKIVQRAQINHSTHLNLWRKGQERSGKKAGHFKEGGFFEFGSIHAWSAVTSG